MLLQTLNPWQQPSSTMNCHFSATLNQLGSASQSAAEDFPLCFHTTCGMYLTAGTGSTRTTNALESFHHSFNSLLSCTHPAVWKLLESLEAQQNQITDAEDKQRRHFQGFSHQQKKKRTDHEPHLPIHSSQCHGFPQRHWLQLPHLNLLMFLILIF